MPVVKADHIDATAPLVRGQLLPVHTTTGRAGKNLLLPGPARIGAQCEQLSADRGAAASM